MERIDLGASTASAVRERRHPKAVTALCILVLFTILSYADRMVISLLVDPIKADLGINDVQFSLLTGLAFALCFGLASLPLAWVADRYSRRWVIFGGVFVWSLATAGGGVAASFGEMFLSRFFVGVGEAALAPAAFAMIPDLFPRHQVAKATGFLASAAALGGGMAVLSGGYLADLTLSMGPTDLPIIGDTMPWQMVFLILGLPGILIAFLTVLLPSRKEMGVARRSGTVPKQKAVQSLGGPDILPEDVSVLEEGYLQWLKANWLFMAGLSLGCSALATLAYGLTTWTPAYLSRVYGFSLGEIGITLGLVQMISGLVGYIGGGALIDWMEARGIGNAPYRYLLGATCVAMVGALGGFYFAGSAGMALTFIGIYHLAAPFNSPMVVALQKAVPASHRGQAIALATMVATLVGLLVGPTAIALFTEQVYGDPAAVGRATASVGVICGIVAFASLSVSYRAGSRARERLQLAEARLASA